MGASPATSEPGGEFSRSLLHRGSEATDMTGCRKCTGVLAADETACQILRAMVTTLPLFWAIGHPWASREPCPFLPCTIRL